MQVKRIHAATIGVTMLAAFLSGCGAGAGGTEAPAADAGRYQDMASYCQAQPPGPTEPVRDGWVQSWAFTANGYTADSTTIVSADGSSAEGLDPVGLRVAVHDYRGIAGNTQIVPPGYLNPDWNMGAVLPTVMAPKAVACVLQLAKLKSSSQPPLTLPGQQPSVSTTLYWRSFWNEAVPMAQLPGYQIDGFEFVSNFTPSNGQAYFILDKQRFTTPQDMSICFLAAGAGQWNCSRPEVKEQSGTWVLRLTTLQPGVYVLNAPSPRG